MLRVSPFEAVRPEPKFAAEAACVPYDVVSRDEARRFTSASPRSFMHVVRPDADLPDATGPYDASVYAKGRESLDRLQRDGTLLRDPKRRVYLYRQEADLPGLGRQSQTGVVCCCDVRDYDSDLIKKHEKTRKDKEDDRVRHMLALNAHAEPVFLAHRPIPGVDAFVARAATNAPLYDFTAADGVRHSVWAIDDYQPLLDALASAPCAYVADGHHRCAAASRAAAEKRKSGDGPDAQSQRLLAVLFPSDQLKILPYHRVVTDLSGMTPDAFLTKLRSACEVTEAKDPTPPRSGGFCLLLAGRWWLCEFKAASISGAKGNPVNSLDVSLLSDLVLAPMLGIADLRTDKRIDFVGGIRGTKELERLVESGKAQAAFSMFPTTMDQLLSVADAGLMMPPKSTWFEPKLRSGLLVHMLD